MQELLSTEHGHPGDRIVALYSMKGGVGVTVTTALLALQLARTEGRVLAVDLSGDLATVFGGSDAQGPGVSDWLVAPDAPSTEALRRVTLDLGNGVELLPAGTASFSRFSAGRLELLVQALQGSGCSVVIDAGALDPSRLRQTRCAPTFHEALLSHVSRRWLVSRNCYLSVRASANPAVAPLGIVLLTEPGRPLRAGDIEGALGAPVVLDIAVDPAIARLVDCGLLAGRVPRALHHRLAEALREAA